MDFRRRGVASVIGTIFFVVVFMLALGSLAYTSGLQAQASQSEQQAQEVMARRVGESLVFQRGGGGLSAEDAGRYSVGVNHIVLKFPNGTVYALPVTAVLAAGASIPVEPLVPPVVCSPGTATCLSKYDQIISGDPSGSSVGLLTSLGNTFWYAYAGAQPVAPITGMLAATQTSTGSSWVLALSVSLSPGTDYLFSAEMLLTGHSTVGGSVAMFSVGSLPAGASLDMFCTGAMPTPSSLLPNCTASPGAGIENDGGSVQYGVQTIDQLEGLVRIGPVGGTLQIYWRCDGSNSYCPMLLDAGSWMMSYPAS